MIRIQNLDLTLDGTPIFRGIDTEIPARRLTAVIGPNSTAITSFGNCLAALLGAMFLLAGQFLRAGQFLLGRLPDLRSTLAVTFWPLGSLTFLMPAVRRSAT